MKPVRSALFVGIVALAFLVSLGQVMAPDVGTSDDTDNTLSVTVTSQAPVIWNYRITDAADTNLMHTQIDVLQTHYFNLTLSDENGWADITYAEIHIWFDGGNDATTYAAQTTGANYRANVNYTNAGPPNTPALSEWSVTEGNLAYNATDSAIFTNGANQNYTFKLSFDLNAQVHQADLPVTFGTGNYDDANSWNSEVYANDTGGNAVTNQQDLNGYYHEFGVYQYTSVSISANWDAGSLAPGQSGTTAAVSVSHQSNDDYNMTVWFTTDLTSGGNTIPVQYVNITATGDSGDDITTDQSFGGTGIGNAEIIRSFPGTGGHQVAANSDSTTVQFRVFVPFGTPTGTYTANLTIRVAQ